MDWRKWEPSEFLLPNPDLLTQGRDRDWVYLTVDLLIVPKKKKMPVTKTPLSGLFWEGRGWEWEERLGEGRRGQWR